jgi:hypothetical protein
LKAGVLATLAAITWERGKGKRVGIGDIRRGVMCGRRRVLGKVVGLRIGGYRVG